MSTEEQVVDKEVENQEAPKEGTEYVEFPDEKTEKRFKKIYWNMKQYEQTTNQLAQQNAKLIEKLESMEKAQAEKESKGHLQTLAEREKEAMENGDFSRASEIRDQITDLKVAAAKPVEAPKEEAPWLTPDREKAIAEWAGETNDKGEFIRPWAADETHEDHEIALDLTIAYVERNPNADLKDILDAVDKKMGRVSEKPKPKQAAVLSGDGGIRPKTPKKTTLSENEKLIARRMFPNEKDPLARYVAAKEKYQ